MRHIHDLALEALSELLNKEPASHTASGQSNAAAQEETRLGGDVVGGGHLDCLGATLTDEALGCSSVGQRQIVERQMAIREGNKHVGHAQLDLLVGVGDLVAVPPARPRLLRKRFALGDREIREVSSEVHGKEFTRG